MRQNFATELHTVRHVVPQHGDRIVTTYYCDVASPYVLPQLQNANLAAFVQNPHVRIGIHYCLRFGVHTVQFATSC